MHVKKKQYQFHKRSQIVSGLANTAEGHWKSPGGISDLSDKAFAMGYKGALGRRGQGK